MRTLGHAPDPMVGREAERRRVDELVAGAAAGHGGALVLHGEAGIGKSALLDHARRGAAGLRVIEATGAEFEAELPFASLHQLCVPVLDQLDAVAAPYRDALRVAFGQSVGAPDPFRIGLAVLELFTTAARERPLLCVVDDAQWLDAASSRAMAFLARRIAVEPIAVLFATRDLYARNELGELPSLALAGLSAAEARDLLVAASPLVLDEQVRDRLLAEARGNPLALLELPRAGGFAAPSTSAVPTRVERGFQVRLAALPDGARQLLTLAGAEPTGDPGLLWAAARRLGIDVAAACAAATATGLVEFAGRVRFCHPLARSAAYRTATVTQRLAAHRALAEATDPVVDPDRRAWHRADASAGPDDDVAAELERSAARAESRGGAAAAAAFLGRAAELSLDPAQRIERTLAAVRTTLTTGDGDTAAHLLGTVENAALDDVQRAGADLLRGQIAFLRHHDGDGPAFVLRAAQRLATTDPEWSRNCFLDALDMALVVGRASGMIDMVLAAARDSPSPRTPDVLDALGVLTTRGHRIAVPLLRAVLDGDGDPLWTRRPGLATMIAGELIDPDAHAAITQWLVKTGRESGSVLVLRQGLSQVVMHSALTGELGTAMEALAEEEAITDAVGLPPLLYPQLQLAAMRGRRREATERIEAAVVTAAERGGDQLVTTAHWAAAVLHNGLADYPAALAAAQRATADGDLFLTGLSLPELVEAAVRCGEPDLAHDALQRLEERASTGATTLALAIAAYSRGLATGVEEHYREAVARLDETTLLPYRARSHLLYGEWLRRAGRRQDSRSHLRTAHQLLSGAGLEAFARRAADELRATGERPRARAAGTSGRLTVQEVHIARLVGTGATTSEVAGRLFLSPRTVDAHLRNIFRKLDITSRRQLRDHPGLGG